MTGADQLDLLTVVTFAAAAFGKRAGTCDGGISVVTGRGVADTIASTSDVPARFEWLQHKVGQGPGVEPVQDDPVLCSADLAVDTRWPVFGPLCESIVGVRSLIMIDIPVWGSGRAALSLYSSRARAFDAGHMVRAARFAQFATASVQRYVQRWELSEREAVGGNNRLAAALGVIMSRYRLTSARAFEMLRDSAGALNLEILELATDVILTGRLPAREIGVARRNHKSLAALAAR